MFKSSIDDLSLRFLQLLIEKKRENQLKNICLYVISLYKQEQGIQEGMITTAKPLEEEHKQDILKFITKKFKMKIELSEKVDPDIIGGFILRIEDQQINSSIRARLMLWLL